MKTVIFDFDGTLADSISLAIELYNQFADEYSVLPIDDLAEARSLAKLGYSKAMRVKRITPLKLLALVRTGSRELPKHMSRVLPYPGIVEAVSRIKTKGYRLGILTSNQGPLVQNFLQAHSFPAFDFVVSEKTLFRKDKALRKIMKRYKLIADEVVFVGDEPRDIQAAIRLGVKSIGVTWGLAGIEGFGESTPDSFVSTADELVAAIQ